MALPLWTGGEDVFNCIINIYDIYNILLKGAQKDLLNAREAYLEVY